ncbi:MAG: proline dehydrogenase family protein [Ignavibacteria bacterium]
MSFFNNILVYVVQLMPKNLVWIFSKKYIAGKTLEEAVALVKKLNEKGIYATIDVLGEMVKNKEESALAKQKCLEVLDVIVKNNLMANLSVKPTQMGLSIDEEFAYLQIEELVKKAFSINNFIRIDMEDSPYTDATFRIYDRLRKKYDSVGVVVQAYLKRTYDDVTRLNGYKANYRLCKGIYIEPAGIAYKGRQEIRENFLKILELIFKSGKYAAIATHDEYLINESYKMVDRMNIPEDKFEFQMLLGVREDLRDKISRKYKMRIYVPFGNDWYRYSVRRLKENPQIAGHIFKNIFSFR